jgi:hypothetical protein
MAKAFWATICIAVGVTGCNTRPPADPPVWSANYAMPFDVMVNCLSTSPAGAFTVSAPTSGFGGIVRIAFTPTNAPQAGSEFVVYHLPQNGTQVNWRQRGNIGGLDWLDGAARSRADQCGNNQFRTL